MDHICNLLWLAFSVALVLTALNRRLANDYVVMWFCLVIAAVTVLGWAGLFPTGITAANAG